MLFRSGMDFIMDSRLVYCLQNGLPLDMDVYDLAEWCCLAELGPGTRRMLLLIMRKQLMWLISLINRDFGKIWWLFMKMKVILPVR